MDDPLRQPRTHVASGNGAALRLRISGAAITALLAIGSFGCRTNPVDQAYVQTLHSEIRMLEDEIYAIESEYEKNLALLEACQNRNAAATSGASLRNGSPNPLRGLPSVLEPRPSVRERVEPELLPPAIDGGEPLSSGASSTGTLSRPASSGSRSRSGGSKNQPPMLEAPNIDLGELDPSFGEPLSGEIEQQSYEEPVDVPTEARVTHIVLNPRLTGGLDFNGAPGDDGLNVVVEPRNQDDVFVPLAGQMSLVLLDPRQEGDAARVARWDLPPDEVRRRIKTDEATAPGIHLKLPWNALPPSHEDLLLFVRYQTPDGRQVEAQAALTLAVSGKSSTRWTPRSPEAAGARTGPQHAVPPHLSAGDLPPASSVPTVADLRRNEPESNWTTPKSRVAPAAAETPIGPAAPPKATLKPPEWKPYR
ncbi:MAG TPA: hypothetical protein VGN57_02705 [Pirellulaceae bacterium]|jgi:hypothetical protein|nr:hypothetical protein [Pirellulaceae bacterium]